MGHFWAGMVDGAAVAGGLGNRGEQFHVVHALVEGRAAGQRGCLVDAGDLFEERPGLVGEGVVLAEPDARGVHRQATGQVRVLRPEDDLPVTGLRGLALAQEQLDLGRPTLIEAGGAVLAEHLEDQAVGVPGGDPGHLDGTRAVLERRGERGVVVVGDGFEHVADLGVIVAHHGAQRQRALVDHGAELPATDRRHVAAEELGHVGHVAADVGERAGAGEGP